MELIIIAIILGIVEGLTEFIPVSSTGHLIIAGKLLGFEGESAKCFEVFIQLGAILAVVWLYKDVFIGLFKPIFRTKPNFKPNEFKGWYGLYLLFLTTLPALIAGALLHDVIKECLFSPFTVSCALATGAIAILLVERFKPTSKINSIDKLTPKHAILIGIFQCLSLWSGFSRSASTIMGAMVIGIDRKTSAVYSFLAAVPVMFAATSYDLYKTWNLLTTNDILYFSVGFIISFISAIIAVKTFIKLLQRWTLTPFAVYRLIIAVLTYLIVVR